MSKPLFSIIVPVYNVEPYLDRCVKSLIGQTYQNIEIILVDDGSTDSSPEICDDYAKNDERIKVIHKINGGPSDARNIGIDKAEGEYILFVDSDDYIEKETCEQLKQFTKLGCDVITLDGMAEGTDYQTKHFQGIDVYNSEEYLKKSIQENALPFVVWLYTYKKTFLDKSNLRLKVGFLHEDEHFIPRVLLNAETIVNSNINGSAGSLPKTNC